MGVVVAGLLAEPLGTVQVLKSDYLVSEVSHQFPHMVTLVSLFIVSQPIFLLFLVYFFLFPWKPCHLPEVGAYGLGTDSSG